MNSSRKFVEDMLKKCTLIYWFSIGFTLQAQINVDEVKRITEMLCSPEFHGRGYVNDGDKIAADFIAKEFEKVGLKKLGSSYFQSFDFIVNRFPGDASIVKNGIVMVMGEEVLLDPACPEFRGVLRPKVFTAAEVFDQVAFNEQLKKMLGSSNNNCVAINITSTDKDTLAFLNRIKYELTQYLPVIEITDKKFTWSVSRNQLKHVFFQVKKEAFKAGIEYEVLIDADLKNHTTQNVIGFLPAKKKAKKTIVFTAHYDHLGRLGRNVYFPGANDNASGTAMIIALADFFKQTPIDDYNLLFIAFAGEEAGLLGSKYFVEHPLLKLKKIKFLINLDIMGSGEDGITVVNGSVFQEQFDRLKNLNTQEELVKTVNIRGKAANSDHYWFTEKGVPAFFIYTMGPNKNYHDVFDTYENLTFAETLDLATLLRKFVEGF